MNIKHRLIGLADALENKWIVLSNPALKYAFSVKSHLTFKERLRLFELSRNSKTVLEIGSYLGASACCFGAALKKSGSGNVLCIDTWNNDAMTEGNRNTYVEFTKNTKTFTKFIVPVRGFSTEVIEQVMKQTEHVDLLFIDGDHSYEGVKADWDTYKRFLKSGSIVVFHDWGWAEGVKRVIEEDVKSRVMTFDALPNMWWGTIRE